MSKHTPEPWIVTGSERVRYIESRIGGGMLQEIASLMMCEVGDVNDNALRIASCVNACSGMEDPEKEIAWLRKHRDELLAALELAESAYRLNVITDGEPSSILCAMQKAINNSKGAAS